VDADLLQIHPMGTLEIAFLAAGGVALVLLSLPAVRHRQPYGIPRFLAFLSILLLIVWNIRAWFTAPFAPHQIVSWMLLAGSLLLVIPGVSLLRTVGRPADGFEDTTRLVTTGIYRYIRHPMYGSLLLLAWGAFFKRPSLAGGALAAIATAALYATARMEEKENIQRFGKAYVEYRRRTKMFVPYLL
jgi:protein-S-isoprenylcysteine O-methyltransferase Ste14